MDKKNILEYVNLIKILLKLSQNDDDEKIIIDTINSDWSVVNKNDSATVLEIKSCLAIIPVVDERIKENWKINSTSLIEFNKIYGDKLGVGTEIRTTEVAIPNTPMKATTPKKILEELDLVIFHFYSSDQSYLTEEDRIKNILRFNIALESIRPFTKLNTRTFRIITSILLKQRKLKISLSKVFLLSEFMDYLNNSIIEYRNDWQEEFWFEKLFNLIKQ